MEEPISRPWTPDGMPGFPKVVLGVAETYRTRRGEVVESTEKTAVATPAPGSRCPESVDPLTPNVLHEAYQALLQSYDFDNGGFGMAPKFPQPMISEFVLRYYHLTKSPQGLADCGDGSREDGDGWHL